MNHLITEELPSDLQFGGGTISNSDPVTGQAGWYDVRVRIRPAEPEEPQETFPQVAANRSTSSAAQRVIAYFAGSKKP